MDCNQIDQRIIDAMKFVFTYAQDVDDWLVIKKEIVRSLPSEMRILFSKRDPKTRLQVPNELEVELMKRWSELTGRKVILTKDGSKAST